MSDHKARKRARLSEAQNHRCCYCGCEMEVDPNHPRGATLEHYQAKAHGGLNHRDNCVIACRTCNTTRGTENPQKFFNRIRQSLNFRPMAPA